MPLPPLSSQLVQSTIFCLHVLGVSWCVVQVHFASWGSWEPVQDCGSTLPVVSAPKQKSRSKKKKGRAKKTKSTAGEGGGASVPSPMVASHIQDNRTIITSSRDCIVKFWRVAPEVAAANALSAKESSAVLKKSDALDEASLRGGEEDRLRVPYECVSQINHGKKVNWFETNTTTTVSKSLLKEHLSNHFAA